MSEVKLRLAIRDLYRGDGGPLNDLDQGWNDGVDAAAEVFSALSLPTSVTCDAHMHNMGSVSEPHYVVDVEIAQKLERQRDAAVAALKAARKTLNYCAMNPMQLYPANNMQHIVASNALGDLDAVLREIEEGKS